MARAFALLAAAIFALVTAAGAGGGSDKTRGGTQVRQIRELSLEFVGQFQNSPPGVAPPTHTHYGYLSYIGGLPAFGGAAENETTALFTFFAEAATARVIANGPMRIVTRVGQLTIYRDASPDGDFANPDSFRDGTPVLVARFRQQSVLNTVTGTFTTFHRNRVVATRRFPAVRGNVQLSQAGAMFRTFFSGQGTMPGPPSGFFGGYAVSG